MRAVFFENLVNKIEDNECFVMQKDPVYHHLITVLRLKNDQEIILFDGVASCAVARLSISKKNIIFHIQKYIKPKLRTNINLFIGLTKIESFKRVLQNACECGVFQIYPVSSQYSQSYKINSIKMKKILISASEQSNNFIIPKLNEVISINKVLEKIPLKSKNYLCGTNCDFQNKSLNLNDSFTCIKESEYEIKEKFIYKNLFIGPEGGWSDNDLNILSELSNINYLSFNTPILRSYNALIYAISKLI